ncbi:MAG: hypothetical protein IJ058_00205 [Lachnospiraceae bacterium]|nr:hypothetical protein [Lachnospiraceae bacterium]
MAGFDVFNLRNSINDDAPDKCEFCGGAVKYSGLGEYICEKCGKTSFDSYGRVRNYLESNPGATAIEVSHMTGVSKAVIKKLIDSDRIQHMPYRHKNDQDI